MLSVDQRRIVDGEITKEFLRVNRERVDGIIAEFGRQAAGEAFAGYHFYLKGGNALAMLQGNEPTGDYDFQLMPRVEDYQNWPRTIRTADERICQALRASLQNVQDDFEEGMFDIATLTNWCRDGNRPLGRAGISFDRVNQGPRRQAFLRIGSPYGVRTYGEIIRDPNFRNGRLELGEDGIEAERMHPENGPMIYVNYTIPGFILFRMAYSYRYVDANGEEFSLKSEIIDVSVPRKGSAEVYLSQEGVITHFRPSGRGFLIPGWGYHLYENINLLQEIELKISGSPHKKQKRLERGGWALEALQRAGRQENVVGDVVWEPEPEGLSQILGYLGALLYNVDDYGSGVFRISGAMIQRLREILLAELTRHFETVRRNRPISLELFCQFRLNPQFDTGVKTVNSVKNGVSRLLISYNAGCYGVENLCMTAGRTYRFLTPYEEIQGKGIFPLDFGVAGVREEAYRHFFTYCRERVRRDVKGVEGNHAFLLSVHCNGGVFYLIFQNCGAALPDAKISLSQILQRCILESQRYKLAQYMERQE